MKICKFILLLLVLFTVGCGDAPVKDVEFRKVPYSQGTAGGMREGETACTTIYFLTDGTPVILSRTSPIHTLCLFGDDTITINKGEVYGRLSTFPIRKEQRTGYNHLDGDMIVVYLEK